MNGHQEVKKDQPAKGKIYLGLYLQLSEREDLIIEQINRIRVDKSHPATVNDGMPKGSGHSDLSDYAALLDEKLFTLEKIRAEKYRARKGILDRVNQIPDKEKQILLRLIYIQGLQIADAGAMLGYGRTKVYDMHKSAVEYLRTKEKTK